MMPARKSLADHPLLQQEAWLTERGVLPAFIETAKTLRPPQHIPNYTEVLPAFWQGCQPIWAGNYRMLGGPWTIWFPLSTPCLRKHRNAHRMLMSEWGMRLAQTCCLDGAAAKNGGACKICCCAAMKVRELAARTGLSFG